MKHQLWMYPAIALYSSEIASRMAESGKGVVICGGSLLSEASHPR